MSKRSGGSLRLLATYARPFAGALVVVFVLNAVGALLQQGSYLLLQPTWTLLFGDPAAEAPELAEARERLLALQAEDPTLPLDAALEALTPEQEAEPEDDMLGRARGWMNERLLDEPGNLTPERRLELLGVVALVISLMALVAAGAQYLAMVMSARISHSMVVALRQDLARHLASLSLSFHGRRKFGDLLSRISADVGQTLQVTNIVLKDLVQEPLMAGTALLWAFFAAPEATLFVLIGTPVLVIPIGHILRKVKKRSTRSQTQLGASMQVLTQLLQGIRTVKAYRAEERELERFAAANRTWIHEAVRLARTTALSGVWTILYTHAGLGLIVLLVGWLAVSGRMSRDAGEMLTFFMLISRSYASIKRTTRALGRVAESQGAAERLQGLFAEPLDIVDSEAGTEASGLGAGVRFEGVGFRYPGADQPALQGLDLELRAGETLALVGPSGSGKSTLVDLVARFLDPTEGRVTVDGVDLRELSLDSWTRQYAMVTQVPFLFHTSVGENIRYGRPEASEEEVRGAAEAAGIGEFIESLPQGLDTDVEDAGARLSGGQRQRLTIARAFLRGAPLLLLDEATSALDSESERLVQAALERLMDGHTVLVIAHRLSTIRRADRIAVLDQGRLVELGSHDELVAAGGLYARLWSMQQDGNLPLEDAAPAAS